MQSCDCLNFSKLATINDCTQLVFSLFMDSDFKWRVNAGDKVITSSDSILTFLPQHLVSVNEIVTVVKFLDSCKLCIGNADTRYFPLQERRKGKFMDTTGIVMSQV